MARVLEVGNPEKSKKLFSNTFTANQVQATKNPIAEGFGASAQICELEVCLDFTAVDLLGGAATILFATEAQVDAMLDALVSSIEWGSTPLGQMIKPQSLSQLRRNVTGFDGTYPDNVIDLGKTTTIAANTYNGNLRFGVRWALPEYANVGYAHAPFCGSMNDDGLDITFGTGTFTDGNAVVFTIAATSTVTVRLRTEVGRPVARVSPLVYATSVAVGVDGSQFPKGGYYALGNLTDNATTVAPNVAGSGYRIIVDGDLVQQYSSHDPRSRYLAISKGWEDRGSALRSHFAGIASENVTPLNQNWNPLFSADIRGNASERIEVTDRMVVDQGSLWTGAGVVWGYVFVRPMKDIGAGIGPCGCGPNEREIQVRLKNPLRLTNAQGDPKGSMISPRAIVSTE
jgi:hypothetical protein